MKTLKSAPMTRTDRLPRLLLAVASLLLLACGGCHGASRRERTSGSDTLELQVRASGDATRSVELEVAGPPRVSIEIKDVSTPDDKRSHRRVLELFPSPARGPLHKVGYVDFDEPGDAPVELILRLGTEEDCYRIRFEPGEVLSISPPRGGFTSVAGDD